jgi:asparagine synthase (glutamine-hydrolysing)
MCGICGYMGDGPPALQAMNATLVHRGPDDDGHVDRPPCHLAMRRLAIVDVDAGQQPVANEDQTVLAVFNGEIYNHVELRQRLQSRGHVFRSHHSDSETIVHLYEEYGDDWPEAGGVNGMFAVALWDSRRGRLLLYRDRLGKKPLYYAEAGTALIFASEQKAILAHPAVSRDVDHGSLYHYFSLKNVGAPGSAWAAIRQLPPGHLMIRENGRTAVRPYWRPTFAPVLPDITPDEAAREILRLLDDAVRLRMRCDAAYGAYLSGGVDSSAVVTLMARHTDKPIQTFCLGYEDGPGEQLAAKAQDIAMAREVARRLGTEHREHIIRPVDFIEAMPAVMASFDAPYSGTISTFFLSSVMKRHIKVALSGDGADELFGSYLAHRLAWPIHHFLRLRPTSLEALSDADRSLLQPFDFATLSRLAHPSQAHWRMGLAVFNDAEKCQLLTPAFLAAAGQDGTRAYYDGLERGATALDPLNAVLEMDQRELLANQVLPFMDRLSMAHSVEVRSPFLDHRIVDFVNRLPGSMKIHNGITKYVHRLAMEPLLPREILDRPKEGFVQPVYSWMRTSLRPWLEALLAPERVRRHGFLRTEGVAAVLAAHLAAEPGSDAKIWNLACFQVWCDTVLGGGGP